jgi:hypothetical protein
MCQSDQLLGLFHVLLDGVVAAVEHDGREAGLDAGLAALIGAVVQVQGNGNGDTHGIDHSADHGSDGLEAGHVLAGTLGNAQNDGALHFLAGGQDCLGPLQVIDVELRHTVVAIACFEQHLGCIYQHYSLPPNMIGVFGHAAPYCARLNKPTKLVYPKPFLKSIQTGGFSLQTPGRMRHLRAERVRNAGICNNFEGPAPLLQNVPGMGENVGFST